MRPGKNGTEMTGHGLRGTLVVRRCSEEHVAINPQKFLFFIGCFELLVAGYFRKQIAYSFIGS